MLLPIDIVIAIIYWSMTKPVPSLTSMPFDQVWPQVLLTSLIALGAVEIGTRMMAEYIRLRGLHSAPAQTLVKMSNNAFRAFLVMVYIFQLRQLNWPGSLTGFGWEILDSTIGLSPYFLTVILSWQSTRRLENIVRHRQWNRASYMLHRLRYSFFIFIPWLSIWLLVDLASRLAPALGLAVSSDSSWLEPLAMLPLLFLTILLFPWLLVRLWGCKPLESERLNARLDEIQSRAGIRFSRVWLWNLGGGSILNAAVLGFIKPCRYLLLSRGLLQNLTEDEITAVVGHELGHVRYRHLWWYMLFTGAYLLGTGVLMSWWLVDGHLVAIGVGLSLAFYIRFIFGFISRNFERQADLYAAQTLGKSDGLISSLEKIAFASGNTRKAKCWHHASIAERVAFLRSVEENPVIATNHHNYCAKLRRSIGLPAAVIILTIMIMGGNFADYRQPAGQKSELYPEYEHWRRVMLVVKDDAEAPLKLEELALSEKTPPAARTPEAIEGYRRIAEGQTRP